MEDLKVGDSVRLINHLGPVMMVAEIDDNIVNCVWFDKHDVLHGNGFYIEMIEKFLSNKFLFGRLGEWLNRLPAKQLSLIGRTSSNLVPSAN